jgi:hypothetical protein
MADEPFTEPPPPGRDQKIAAHLPGSETEQPDPMLQMSTGRMGAGGITIAAVVMALILGVVLYGLNGRASVESSAAPPSTTASHTPAAGGNSSAATPGAPRANESGVKG